MKKHLFLTCAAAVMALLSGCRSQLVAIDVTPSDATVIAQGVAYNGGSPMFIEVSRKRQLAITAYKEGYREKMYVIDYSLSECGKIEAYTSIFLIPLLWLTAPCCYELNQNNIKIVLEPLNNQVNETDLSNTLTIEAGDMDRTTDENAARIFGDM